MNDTFETMSQHGITYVRLFHNPEVIGEFCSVSDDCYVTLWVAVSAADVPPVFPTAVPEPSVWVALLLGAFAVYVRGLMRKERR